jgi:hypothetical protein
MSLWLAGYPKTPGFDPLWVKSGHRIRSAQCPLYPRKRTSIEPVAMSALCQKQTHALQQKPTTSAGSVSRLEIDDQLESG